MKKYFPILLTILFSILIADNNDYNISNFIEGTPKEIKWLKQPNAITVNINTGQYFKNAFLIFNDSNEIPDNCKLWTIKHDGGISPQRLEFTKINDILFETKIDLLNDDEDTLAPLIFEINLGTELLKYYWGDDKKLNPYIRKEYKLKKGCKFPNINIKTENSDIKIEELKGKIIVINWWSTFCSGCVDEIPELNELVKKYKQNDVVFLSIVYDFERLDEFKKKHEFIYLHGEVDNETEKLLKKQWPRNIIINKDGIIHYNESGYGPEMIEQLEQSLIELIKKI